MVWKSRYNFYIAKVWNAMTALCHDPFDKKGNKQINKFDTEVN